MAQALCGEAMDAKALEGQKKLVVRALKRRTACLAALKLKVMHSFEAES